MPEGEDAVEPRKWLVEIIAGLSIAAVIGIWAYQTIEGDPDTAVSLLFVAVAGSAIVFVFGVDRVRAWYKLFGKK